MVETQRIETTWKSKPTLERAGVHLRPAFGFDEVPQRDPSLAQGWLLREGPAI